MSRYFKIEVLSPVHIGNGNTIKPIDIGEYEGFVYIFNLDKAIEKIPSQSMEEFSNLIIDFGSKKRNMYKNIGEVLSKKFGVGYDSWSEISLYRVRKRADDKIYEIYEELKYHNKVYIPGSSIKGVIRTAIIYYFLKEKGYSFSIKEVPDKNGRKGYKKVKYLSMVKPDGREIEGLNRNNNPDFSRIESEISRDMFASDPTKDIFKCLQISDSNELQAEDCLEVRTVYVANTTSFEKKERRARMFPLMVECIKEGKMFTNISIAVNDKVITSLSKIHKDRRFYDVVEFIRNWKGCLREFSRDLVDAEIKFWEEKKSDIKNNVLNVYRKFEDISSKFNPEKVIENLNDIKQLIDEGEVILRLGKFSGYFSHSIGLLFAKEISGKPYNLSELGRMLYKTAHDDLFPLTRRLTLDNQTLGWCRLVESDEDNDNSGGRGNSKDINNENMMDVFMAKGWRVKK